MAKSSAGKGVSLSSRSFTKGAGLGPGPIKITEAYFGMHDYGGTRKGVAALFLKGKRHGEEVGPEPWTCGGGWRVSEDGQELIPKAGQTGLVESAKLSKLIDSLERDGGMPSDFLTSPDKLVGVNMTLISLPLPKIEGKDQSVLVCASVESAPWMDGKKGKGKKAKDDDDEDEDTDSDEDEDEDEDEKPAKGKKKPAAAADDDDDEDEEEDAKPAKGKKKPAADDDDDDDEADLTEEAGEALIAALEDGPIKLKDVKTALLAQLKGNKQAKAIAAAGADEEFLNAENGWSFNGKVVKLA